MDVLHFFFSPSQPFSASARSVWPQCEALHEDPHPLGERKQRGIKEPLKMKLVRLSMGKVAIKHASEQEDKYSADTTF